VRLKLWDEERGALVTFTQARTALADVVGGTPVASPTG
jgi:hypothetical protein